MYDEFDSRSEQTSCVAISFSSITLAVLSCTLVFFLSHRLYTLVTAVNYVNQYFKPFSKGKWPDAGQVAGPFLFRCHDINCGLIKVQGWIDNEAFLGLESHHKTLTSITTRYV